MNKQDENTIAIFVLNLIINGLPSILLWLELEVITFTSFKTYYNWITFNTFNYFQVEGEKEVKVLNLIINGLPSIL